MTKIAKDGDSSHVTLEKSSGIAHIYINRPNKRNALGQQTIEELVSALAAAEHDNSTRVVILSGTGTNAFASGADLDELPTAFASPANARAYDEKITRLYHAMAKSRLPVIARMAGHAIGGGCLLALASDFRIAAAEIKVGFPIALIGLMLSPYEHELILDHATPSSAKMLMFTGRRILAPEAKSLGLIDIVVPKDELDTVVNEFAQQIVAGAPLAISAAKSILNAIHRQSDVEQTISRAYETIYSSSDLVEGLAAIHAKRFPVFSGQ
ncbi:MAG: enoyl-CoA hydratase/isomerase family protein [Candidimonas sp.]|nr:MAG: enoyl-CoA hydratase/isomerase family protein [Candidimonas sp.]TAM25731.1 MAG: enoyl-CoA hydratase/isomerase family protein [Candidimonas sp.]TAM75345.1 MAG: enoyl-CoA hydratase/isomerase family protein [Candidimonas sp.]